MSRQCVMCVSVQGILTSRTCRSSDPVARISIDRCVSIDVVATAAIRGCISFDSPPVDLDPSHHHITQTHTNVCLCACDGNRIIESDDLSIHHDHSLCDSLGSIAAVRIPSTRWRTNKPPHARPQGAFRHLSALRVLQVMTLLALRCVLLRSPSRILFSRREVGMIAIYLGLTLLLDSSDSSRCKIGTRSCTRVSILPFHPNTNFH